MGLIRKATRHRNIDQRRITFPELLPGLFNPIGHNELHGTHANRPFEQLRKMGGAKRCFTGQIFDQY